MTSRNAAGFVVALAAAGLTSAACAKPTRHTSKVEIRQTELFGDESATPKLMDLDLLFVECPGAQRKIVRGDEKFASCAKKYKAGDTLTAEIQLTWRADRGSYRGDVVKVGDCERKIDPRDDASYDIVQTCTDVVVNGVVTGVRCDRGRTPDLVAKCPWFRRK
ncbi:MAG: hypothetical protein KF819_02695 [Labilithrix sp.]|nr:hypothetical protein [Labilithrix sp.]